MIRAKFERGGELIIELNDSALETQRCILEVVPFESKVLHSRWCGREINFAINTKSKPPLENETSSVSKLDVVYWRDWDEKEEKASEAIALYYGAETLRYHKGLIHANVIGRVHIDYEKILEQIGVRVWQYGMENVVLEIIEP